MVSYLPALEIFEIVLEEFSCPLPSIFLDPASYSSSLALILLVTSELGFIKGVLSGSHMALGTLFLIGAGSRPWGLLWGLTTTEYSSQVWDWGGQYIPQNLVDFYHIYF